MSKETEDQTVGSAADIGFCWRLSADVLELFLSRGVHVASSHFSKIRTSRG